MNAGNLGTEGRYGIFCIVLADPRACAPRALAVLIGDSASTFTDHRARLKERLMLRSVSTWSGRSDVVVGLRASAALATVEEKWPDIICAVGRYFETVTTPFAVTDIDEVRMRKYDRDRIEELEDRHLANEPLKSREKNQVAALQAVRRWATGQTNLVWL